MYKALRAGKAIQSGPWRERLVSQRRWCLRVQKKFSVLIGGGIQMTTWTEAKDPDKARDSGPLGSH